MKKWIRALVAGVVILAVILFGIFVLRNTQKDTKPKQNPEEQNTSVSENSTSNESTAENSTDDPDIIVKDNVKVINHVMKSEDQPTEVFVNSLFFLVNKSNMTCTVSIVVYCLNLSKNTRTSLEYSKRN